ncbi:hypothetical protein R5R35_004909 [Gryllus longicercus]|uniref:Calcineurin-binding protein cabin-1 n=1 Tax=Gryllus longicercus TaxID=2509291 RepID=A0AAN9VJI7_9ORTH
MLRFRALNQESSDESEGEEDAPTITREAQEQHAFSEYRTALSLLREKKIEEAKSLLKGILDGDILPEVDLDECAGHPLSVLKYSCLKNMGSILAQQGDYDNSLAHYMQAAKLDSNDVMLWYHLGSVALKLNHLELARDAFLEGLNYSPKNWECLNSLITVLYVLQDYMTCLVFISRAFELDFTFIKGHTIRDAILEECPSILSDSYLKEIDVGTKGVKCDAKICKEILQEVEELKTARQQKVHDDTVIKYVPMDDPIITMSWIALGKSLLNQHKVLEQRLVAPLKLLHDPEDIPLVKKEVQKEIEAIDNHCNEKTVVPEAIPHSGTESENQAEEVADFTSGQENDDGKGRKRRRNSLLYVAQWMWGEKRRSARVRSTVRREAEREECNLGETLQRILPHTLLPSTEKIKDMDIMKSNDDSMDTMDLYKLFENRENAESRDEKNSQQKVENEPSLNEEGYFGTPSEELDVKNFLNMHNYQDIIEIMSFFLQELYERWQLTWPQELIFLYLEIYKLLRQHVPFPQVLYSSETVEWLQKDGWMTLLYEELALDCWLNERLSEKKTERSVERRPVPIQEIGHLELLLTRFSSDHLLHTRLYWLKAHAYLNHGDIETATGCLDPLLRYLENLNEKDTGSKVVLKNCSHNNLISKESVQQLLTALFRNQNLSEVQYLYDEKRYEELIEVLKETFSYCQQPGLVANFNNSASDCPDRATQLAMLMDAHWQLKRYQDCFHWGEACCNEALHKYLNSDEKEQQKWATILEKLLSGMESCVRKAGLGVAAEAYPVIDALNAAIWLRWPQQQRRHWQLE